MMDAFAHEWPTPPKTSTMAHNVIQMVAELQGDTNFEPQTRARSNTWPCPKPEDFVEPTDELENTKANNQLATGDAQPTIPTLNTSKKNSSRRNAWGNLSYADLITHAIGSAPDNRLTLSQIYEWMVQNVPYFKDKGDSNSSAGWKNSIRHNLSLHNRFMRVQNEGTGKSSWWMLNPDAKPGKSVRRRAASMETSRYEKRRGRAKKRVEALRQAGLSALNDATPSPSSSISEGLDHFPESPLHSGGGFQLSPDFRQRASSNASSCGRLSPIPALLGVEPDWGFPADYQNSTLSPAHASALDQLAGSIAEELTLQKEMLQGFSTASGLPTQPPPPPYQQPPPYALSAGVAHSYGLHPQQCLLHRSLPCSCLHNSREGLSPSSVTTMSPAYPNSEPSSDSMNTYSAVVLETGTIGVSVNDTAALIVQQRQQQQHQQQQQRQPQPLSANLEDNNCASTLIGQCMEALNSETQIDEFTIDNFQGGLECNIEELIQQEMSIDGLLDINIPLTAVSSNCVGGGSGSGSGSGSSGGGVGGANALSSPATTLQINQLQQQQQQVHHHQHHHHQQHHLHNSANSNSNNSNNNNNNTTTTTAATINSSVLDLPPQTQMTTLNARVQYSQASVVTPPSWVH